MGRRKIVIQPIQDSRNKSVTFLKRKTGLMKKAHELAILCQAEIAVIIFNENGKLFEFSSGDISTTLSRFANFSSSDREKRGPSDFLGSSPGELSKRERALGGKMAPRGGQEDDEEEEEEEEEEADADEGESSDNRTKRAPSKVASARRKSRTAKVVASVSPAVSRSGSISNPLQQPPPFQLSQYPTHQNPYSTATSTTSYLPYPLDTEQQLPPDQRHRQHPQVSLQQQQWPSNQLSRTPSQLRNGLHAQAQLPHAQHQQQLLYHQQQQHQRLLQQQQQQQPHQQHQQQQHHQSMAAPGPNWEFAQPSPQWAQASSNNYNGPAFDLSVLPAFQSGSVTTPNPPFYGHSHPRDSSTSLPLFSPPPNLPHESYSSATTTMGSTSNSRNSLTTSTLDDDNMSTLGDSRSPSTDGMRLGSRPLLNVSIPQDSRSTEESTVTQDNQDDHNDQDESNSPGSRNAGSVLPSPSGFLKDVCYSGGGYGLSAFPGLSAVLGPGATGGLGNDRFSSFTWPKSANGESPLMETSISSKLMGGPAPALNSEEAPDIFRSRGLKRETEIDSPITELARHISLEDAATFAPKKRSA